MYPGLQPSTFPFNNVLNHDFELYDSQNDNSSPVQDTELNEDRIDYSELAYIDPDRNFLTSTKDNECLYYNDLSFNESSPKQNNFSVYHVNIRSIPRNLDQLTFYLNNLHHTFSVIAISENWLTPFNKDTLWHPGVYPSLCYP